MVAFIGSGSSRSARSAGSRGLVLRIPDPGIALVVLRVWREHREVYVVRKVWKQLVREGIAVARCTVARLMRRLGLAGLVRERAFRHTTIPDAVATRPRT